MYRNLPSILGDFKIYRNSLPQASLNLRASVRATYDAPPYISLRLVNYSSAFQFRCSLSLPLSLCPSVSLCLSLCLSPSPRYRRWFLKATSFVSDSFLVVSKLILNNINNNTINLIASNLHSGFKKKKTTKITTEKSHAVFLFCAMIWDLGGFCSYIRSIRRRETTTTTYGVPSFNVHIYSLGFVLADCW